LRKYPLGLQETIQAERQRVFSYFLLAKTSSYQAKGTSNSQDIRKISHSGAWYDVINALKIGSPENKRLFLN